MVKIFFVVALLLAGQKPMIERTEMPTMAECVAALSKMMEKMPELTGTAYITGAACERHVTVVKSDPA